MAHTYVTELAGAKTSARGNKYSYTYESHIDEPEETGVKYSTTTFGESKQNPVTTTTTVISPKQSPTNIPLELSNGKRYYNNTNPPLDQNATQVVTEYTTSPTSDVERNSTSTQKVTFINFNNKILIELF